jgi:hypothetical protein
MDKVQKYNSFNTNTPSSESYRNYLNSAGFCGGGHGLSCAAEPRKEEEEEEEEDS